MDEGPRVDGLPPARAPRRAPRLESPCRIALTPELDEDFWAAAYYAPMAETLARWHARVPPPRRFVYVLRYWWPLVHAGSTPDAPSARGRPACVAPWADDAWPAQVVLLLYLCHAPYMDARVPTTSDTQPFHALITVYVRELEAAAPSVPLGAWLHQLPPAHAAWMRASLAALLTPAGATALGRETPCAALASWPAPQYVSDRTGRALYDAGQAMDLLRRAPAAPLDLHQHRWLSEYLRRETARGSALPCLALVEGDTPAAHGGAAALRALLAGHARTATAWVLYTSSLRPSALPPHYLARAFWETLGDALAELHPRVEDGQLTPDAARLVDMLSPLWDTPHEAECELPGAPGAPAAVLLPVPWLVQRFTVPRLLGTLASGGDASEIAFVCTCALSWLQRGCVPLESRDVGRPTTDAARAALAAWRDVGDEQLGVLTAQLRATALHASRHRYGAQLYQLLQALE